MSISNSDFNKLMGKQNISKDACFGNLNIGQQYICPSVGSVEPIQEQALHPWFAKQSRKKNPANCHHKHRNIGRSCQKQGQSGGGDIGGSYGAHKGRKRKESRRMKYSAAGELVPYDCGCGSKEQLGGCGGACACAGHGMIGGAHTEEHLESKEERNMNYPRNTCGCRLSSYCSYNKYSKKRQYGNIIREVPGIYLDLGNTIGNRPIHMEHDNNMNVPKAIPEGVSNMKGKNFGCQQPFWCKSCM